MVENIMGVEQNSLHQATVLIINGAERKPKVRAR